MTKKETLTILHKLWTKAVDAPDYNKKQWIDLQFEIERLLRINSKKVSYIFTRDRREGFNSLVPDPMPE